MMAPNFTGLCENCPLARIADKMATALTPPPPEPTRSASWIASAFMCGVLMMIGLQWAWPTLVRMAK